MKRARLRASLTVRLPVQMAKVVRDLCRERQVTRADLVRRLLADWASRELASGAPANVIDDREQYLQADKPLPEVRV